MVLFFLFWEHDCIAKGELSDELDGEQEHLEIEELGERGEGETRSRLEIDTLNNYTVVIEGKYERNKIQLGSGALVNAFLNVVAGQINCENCVLTCAHV